jgi:predicted HTH domain antitoxin
MMTGEAKKMPTITFDVPDGALSALRLSPSEFVKEMRVAAALLWYSRGELSQSKAAEVAGTSRAEFIDELSLRRIPVVQVAAEELLDEINREWGLGRQCLTAHSVRSHRSARFDRASSSSDPDSECCN